MSAQSPCHEQQPFSWAVLTVPIFLSHTHTHCTKTCTHSLPHIVPTHAFSPSLTHCSNTCAHSLPHKHRTNMCTHTNTVPTHALSPSLTNAVPTRALSPQRDFPHSHTNTHHTNACALSLTHTHCPTHPPSPLRIVPSHSSMTAMASGGGILPAWGSHADGGGEDGEALYVKLGDGQQRMVHPVQEREDAHAQGWTLLNVPAHRATGQ